MDRPRILVRNGRSVVRFTSAPTTALLRHALAIREAVHGCIPLVRLEFDYLHEESAFAEVSHG